MISIENDLSLEKNFIIIHNLVPGTKNAHEQAFIELFINGELVKDSSLASKFILFQSQFFPNYWFYRYEILNPLNTIIFEYSFFNYELFKKTHNQDYDEDIIEKSKLFGNIVMEFLIRYKNYSLIGVSGNKIILTSRNDCDKVFYDYLYNGYSIQKMSKVIYHLNFKYGSLEEGYFEKLDTLPTKDIGINIDEQIEGKILHKYLHVLNK